MKRRLADLGPAQRAGILCNDVTFRRFVAARIPGPFDTVSAGAAAEWLRRSCRVASRRDLEKHPAAAARFDAILTDFDAWRGKILNPR